ncbi:tRNA (adenosine(37)-N6)-threonylcarbamoyltransferase complex ATPase subunit type 1 TsaE [Snodgrassella sp. CFCC 13594]|uniref:tRNA (adenosine(37)-N6)-threonylcarbamoyltransferase complex ATPase subunit type 1 TsaE n=1 Tax=Snodgrassella sp. CFCC 13594 TaxID=1775559 RepID=UPI00082B855C|nr:tRNA (adenosine(37)-N6)-threonylcarbamoyltransferase complex ATPase subunit type 1 TsaE [Snodgrassella sp. CFCC 13594]
MAELLSQPIVLHDEAATLHFGAALAACLKAPLVVWLMGDLGAGKTTLVRGLLRSQGYTGSVKSPTYTLVERYDIGNQVWQHFDLYRFHAPEEWLDAGFDELIDDQVVALIEWPKQAEGFLPMPDLTITLTSVDAGREAILHAHTAAGQTAINALSESSWQI